MAHRNDKGIQQHGKGRRGALLDKNLNSSLANTSKFPLERSVTLADWTKRRERNTQWGKCMVWIEIWVLAAFHFHIITIKPNLYYTSHGLRNKCICNTLIFRVIKLWGKSKSPDRAVRAALRKAAGNSDPFLYLREGCVCFLQNQPFLSSDVLPHSRTLPADPSNWGLIHKYFYLCWSGWRPLKGHFILSVE